MHMPSVSVIVTTYNWPQALDRVLSGLCIQRYPRFEVIVADDGSTETTAEVVRHWKTQCDFSLLHCWQPDEGFRAATIRNRAAATARHNYLIFLDGDCVPLPSFVAMHAQLAQKGWFVAGNRILLSQKFTHQVLNEQVAIEKWQLKKWGLAALSRKCNRFMPFLHLPLGGLRKLSPRRWQGVKTCNLGVWREDFIQVNGMDENYTGWGFEDSDLVVRLQRTKIYRKSGQSATPVLHLWHPFQDRAKAQKNANRLHETIHSTQIRAVKGIDQYLNHDHCKHS